MNLRRVFITFLAFVSSSLLCSMQAQNQPSSVSTLPHVIKYSGVMKDAPTGTVGVIFAIYDKQDSVSPMWLETQSVTVDENGHYNVILGSTKAEGLPASIFASGEARWIGVQAEGQAEQPRTLLVSVPYALKAGDADTLGGKPLSAFLLADYGVSKSGEKSAMARTPEITGAGDNGTQNFLAKFSATGSNINLINSAIVESGGNLGVGTSAPQAKITIGAGSFPDPGIAMQMSTGGANTYTYYGVNKNGAAGFGFGYDNGTVLGTGAVVRQLNSDPMMFVMNGLTEAMRLTAPGNVGIGNTAPQSKLMVGPGGSFGDPGIPIQMSTQGPGTYTYYGVNKNGAPGFAFGYDNATPLGTGAVVRQLTADPMMFVVNAQTEAMRIMASGNVGIGTATPAAKLDVNGVVRAGGGIKFGDGTTQMSAAVGGGTITGVTAGSGLSGGGSNGTLTISVDSSVARTNANNTFGISQTIVGDLNLSGSATVNGVAANFIGFNGGVTGRDTAQDGLARNGVQGFLDSSSGTGVLGEAFSTTGATDGVLGISKSNGGAGVFGHASSTSGNTAGVHGLTHSSSALSGAGWFDNDSSSGGNIIIGRGGPSFTTVFKVDTGGNVTANGGVYGQSALASSIFPTLSSPPPAAIRGDATATSNYAAGVIGGSFSPNGYGVLGANFATGGNSYGVVGLAGTSGTGTGVLGEADALTGLTNGVEGYVSSTSGTAIYGVAGASSGAAWGVNGITYSSGGFGGVFQNKGNGNILLGQNATSAVFRLDGTGKAFLNGGSQVGGADFAESVEIVGNKTQYEPGDLLVIDPNSDRRVTLSKKPYSTSVAGIYSTKPGVLATPHAMDDARVVEAEVPLAVVGIVPCKVTSENGPIHRGDLLVSSSTPGFAMKGTHRNRMLGAVVGKALQSLKTEKGVIQVLVTLQ